MPKPYRKVFVYDSDGEMIDAIVGYAAVVEKYQVKGGRAAVASACRLKSKIYGNYFSLSDKFTPPRKKPFRNLK